jgi:hypothetical protein
MITNEANEIFEEHGLSYDDISSREAMKLFQILNEHLEYHQTETGLNIIAIAPTNFSFNTTTGVIENFQINCIGSWFEKRPGIHFYSEGKITFPGWADETNLKPFRSAFEEWCGWVMLEKEGQHKDKN